jgi:hypothetical protein
VVAWAQAMRMPVVRGLNARRTKAMLIGGELIGNCLSATNRRPARFAGKEHRKGRGVGGASP